MRRFAVITTLCYLALLLSLAVMLANNHSFYIPLVIITVLLYLPLILVLSVILWNIAKELVDAVFYKKVQTGDPNSWYKARRWGKQE